MRSRLHFADPLLLVRTKKLLRSRRCEIAILKLSLGVSYRDDSNFYRAKKNISSSRVASTNNVDRIDRQIQMIEKQREDKSYGRMTTEISQNFHNDSNSGKLSLLPR